MIDRAFFRRQIEVWSAAQPEGTRLTPAEMEQLTDHLYGNAAQLLVGESEAKDRALDALVNVAKTALHVGELAEYPRNETAAALNVIVDLLEPARKALAAAKEVTG